MQQLDPAVVTLDIEREVPKQPPWRRTAGKVVVVLPAFNEEEDLGPLLQRIEETMHEDGLRYHVLVVDDGSKDRTRFVAEEHAQYMFLKLEQHDVNMGLGATIRDGLRAALEGCGDRDIIVVMDADNTHTPGLIRSMIRLVREGNDVVIASRYQPGAQVRGVPVHRRALSWFASKLFCMVFPTSGVRDYTCGYRAYRAPLLREAFEKYGEEFISQEGFQCMVDILLKLRSMGAIFREVPLVLRYDMKSGASKMKIGRTIRRTLELLVRRRLGL